jgi:hypothetical protein
MLMVFTAFPIIASEMQTILGTALKVAKHFVQVVEVILFVAYSVSARKHETKKP